MIYYFSFHFIFEYKLLAHAYTREKILNSWNNIFISLIYKSILLQIAGIDISQYYVIHIKHKRTIYDIEKMLSLKVRLYFNFWHRFVDTYTYIYTYNMGYTFMYYLFDDYLFIIIYIRT